MATEQAQSVLTESDSLATWASWLAALVGLWLLVLPFVLGGAIGSGAAMYSNVIAGFLALVLAGYAGWEHYEAA